MSCIFCQIAAGKLPSYEVYEDQNYLAFLDINPVVEGHTLIIPKKHYRWVYEVKEFSEYWQIAQKIAEAQIKSLSALTVLFLTAGFQIPHAHIHLIPINSGAEIRGRGKQMSNDELKKIARELK